MKSIFKRLTVSDLLFTVTLACALGAFASFALKFFIEDESGTLATATSFLIVATVVCGFCLVAHGIRKRA
jgi:hypothetical protein